MRNIYVADVGDGLCIALYTIAGETIQIDCGSKEGIDVAFKGWVNCHRFFDGPSIFILSHFHIDHYNGLLYASITERYMPFGYRIREVYYPGIPEFKEKKEFICDLLAMNSRLFGSETGVMEYDFLKAISRITREPFKYRPLFKGDEININGSIFGVLWPPKILDDSNTLKVIKRALEDFKKALEEDEEIRRLYEKVKEENVFDTYLRGQEDNIHYRRPYEQSDRRDINAIKLRKRALPKVVEEANISLRKAANHLSLAFFEDNRFLFMGDTETSEIKQIVDDLKSKGRENFYIFITPHHGTHWHNSLKGIKCIYSISSNGSKLCSKKMSHFKGISKRSFATSVNGDIVIPSYPTGRSLRLPWLFYKEI